MGNKSLLEGTAISINIPRPLLFPGDDMRAVASDAAQLFSPDDFNDICRDIWVKVYSVLGNDKKYIGLHIRRGDLMIDRNEGRDWFHKYEPISFYQAIIEKELNKDDFTYFLVVSDDDDLRRFLSEKYDRVKISEDLFPNIGETDLHFAWRDMIALSKCQRVIAPDFSGFSSAGALLGGHVREQIKTCLTDAERRDSLLKFKAPSTGSALTYSDALDLAVLASLHSQFGAHQEARDAIEQAIQAFPRSLVLAKLACTISGATQNIDMILESFVRFLQVLHKEDYHHLVKSKILYETMTIFSGSIKNKTGDDLIAIAGKKKIILDLINKILENIPEKKFNPVVMAIFYHEMDENENASHCIRQSLIRKWPLSVTQMHHLGKISLKMGDLEACSLIIEQMEMLYSGNHWVVKLVSDYHVALQGKDAQ
ncbi:hypothetical protein WG908_01750 [Sphingobium sp. AN641]|uniref:hypothetical protein n=1 Tax=Sphingobium sp. AN641 TaxID=3133443 RepID=UPI0030C53BBD